MHFINLLYSAEVRRTNRKKFGRWFFNEVKFPKAMNRTILSMNYHILILDSLPFNQTSYWLQMSTYDEL